MECFHCGLENNEDAIFCKHCGLRVDGKVQCQECGEMIDFDSQYCEHCGNDMQRDSENQFDSTKQNDEFYGVNKERKVDYKKLLGSIFAIAATLVSFIFTFLIGVQLTDKTLENLTASHISYKSGFSIFYFFGEIYGEASFDEYVYAAIGTALSVAIIAVVTSLAIITLVNYVKYVLGQSNAPYFKFALSTSITYVLGVTLFYALNCSVFKSIFDGAEFSYKLDNITILGLVLSVFLILAAIVCKSTSEKSLSDKEVCIKNGFGISNLVMLSVLAMLIAAPSITITYQNSETNSGFLCTLECLKFVKNIEYFNFNLFLGLIIEIAMLITIFVSILGITKTLADSIKRKTQLGTAIAITILSLIDIIVISKINNEYVEYLGENYSSSVTNLVPIVIISAIFMITEILHVVTRKKLDRLDS